MNGSSGFRLVLFVAINFLLNSPANAGVMKRSVRMVREVYPPDVEPEIESIQPQVCIVGDVVYGADETVPAEQPCLKCKCQPPGVQCETVQCAKKPGCKAIHRPNKCCPDYQCECEHNGKIYANGEKLETHPGGECKVCYCRGGEVQCAEVSCYIRNDCEGKRVPGTCCPRYDHCPPIDSVPDRSVIVTEPPLHTLKPVVIDLWQEPNSTETTPLPTGSSIPEDSNKVPDTNDLVTASPSFEEIQISKEDTLHHRITIQEIIPERKEIPVTAPPRILISEPQGTLVIEEAIPTSDNSSNDLNVDDSEPESSEVSEVFQHPPPVLRVGDKLLILQKDGALHENVTATPDNVITIIGAEGLQRGGVEESLEVHEVKIQPETEAQQVLEEAPKAATEINVNLLSENGSTSKEEGSGEVNDLELKLSESTHILSLVKRRNKPSTTTTTVATTTATEAATTTEKLETSTTLSSIIEEPRPVEPSKKTTLELKVEDTTTSEPTRTTSLTEPPPTKISIEQTPEPNPAYPPIPDVMPSVGDVPKPEPEIDNEPTSTTTTAASKILLPDVIGLLSNSSRNESGHIEWLKMQNDSLLDFKAGMLPEELLNQKSPIDEDEFATLTTVGFDESSTVVPTTVEGSEASTPTKDVNLEENKPLLIGEVDVSLKDLEATSAVAMEGVEGETTTIQVTQRSVESLEDSGEQTTPRTNHSAALHSPENMSIQPPKEVTNKESPLESFDMTLGLEKEKDIELGSVEMAESLPESIPKDVEIISSSPRSSKGSTEKNVQVEENPMKEQVEMLNKENTPNPTKLIKVPETSTYELLPTPEEANSKVVIKREVTGDNKGDDVFKDLEKELNSEEDFHATKKPEVQRAEDEKIFRELIEEAEGKSAKGKPRSKEQESIDSLSDALAGVALKGRIPDPNVLRLIGGLFGGKRK